MRPSRQLRDAVESFAEDFGYDLDEEGQPLDEDEVPKGSEAARAPEDSARDGGARGGLAPRPPSRTRIAMASQRDVKNRIGSVKNIQKITRAMEMVAAARLRRAEQRIAALRPYAEAIRRMTRQAALAAGAEASKLELLSEREQIEHRRAAARDGRPWAGGRASTRRSSARAYGRAELQEQDRQQTVWYATGRRGVSSLTFRGRELSGSVHGVHRPPGLRRRARDRRRSDRGLHGRHGRSRGHRLQLLRLAADPAGHARDAAAALAATLTGTARASHGVRRRGGSAKGPKRPRRVRARRGGDPQATRARLCRDLDLSRADRVGRGILRRADDGDAQRIGERWGDHHRSNARR